MVDQLDTSALNPGNLKSVRDFQVQGALEDAQVQKDNLANSTANSLYATQILSGATATGRQDLYEQAKKHLADSGVDTSSFAPDIQTGTQQVNALRQSFYQANPLNAMLGLGLRAEGNLNTAAGVTGNTNTAGAINPLSSAIEKNLAGMGGALVPGVPANTSGQNAAATAAQSPTDAHNAPIPQINASVLQPPASMQLPANAISGISLPVPNPPPSSGSPKALDANGSTALQFVAPAPIPGDTQAATQQKFQQALEAWKANPDVQRSTAAASKVGSESGDQQDKAANEQEITDRLIQNLNALKTLNPNVPTGVVLDPETKATLEKRLGSSGAADALAQWDQLNHQQILSGLQQLMNTGGNIRSNKTIAQMLQTGAGISADNSVKARGDMIDNLINELQNINTSSQNVNARLNGGNTQPYRPILNTNNSVVSPGTSSSQYKAGALKQGTDGTYVFMGGDPTSKSSWEKVQ